MVRGLETAASAMRAQLINMDVTANNLANADRTGFKRDQTVMKSFPEMLLHRTNSDGLVRFPLGSYDNAPLIGAMGTGVEVNGIMTDFSQGRNLKPTNNDFDLALEGKGFFVVMTDQGERYTRDGSFTIDDQGYLVTKHGYKVMTNAGPIQIKQNNFLVDEWGTIRANMRYSPELGAMVDRNQNTFDMEREIARLKVVVFDDPRYLGKDGLGFYKENRYTGPPLELPVGDGRSKIRQGYLESSNVNVVQEMTNMIKVQRSYEAAAKALTAHDDLLGRLINEVGRA